MRVGVLGMNYKLSDLTMRELFAKKTKNLVEKGFLKHDKINQVVLSTCNRTEIYFSAEDLAEAHSCLLEKIREEMRSDEALHLYSYFGEQCFAHLAKVTSGVDSVLFGESEIQRQVKEAYEKAALVKSLPAPLHFLFQKSLKIGKNIRTDFSLPKNDVSLEGIIGDLVRYFFGAEKGISCLFVGFSEVNRKIMNHFHNKGFSQLDLATKSPEAIEKTFFNSFQQLLPWTHVSLWPTYDVIIAGSNAQEYLIRQNQMCPKLFPSKKQLLIDLGLPRNIDPNLNRLPLAALFNIEEVNGFIEHKQKGMNKEKEEVQKIIDKNVKTQIGIYQEKISKVFACA